MTVFCYSVVGQTTAHTKKTQDVFRSTFENGGRLHPLEEITVNRRVVWNVLPQTPDRCRIETIPHLLAAELDEEDEESCATTGDKSPATRNG
jgi:hypothetical protein